MPSIRDLVAAIRQRPGVDAAIVLGPDGLLIAGDADAAVDRDALAARVPALLAAARGLASSSARGDLRTAVLEHEAGLLIVSVLSSEAILIVLVSPSADVGALVLELRRNRQHLASLV